MKRNKFLVIVLALAVFLIAGCSFNGNLKLEATKLSAVEFYNSISEVNGDYKSTDGFLDSYKDSGIPPQIKEFDLWTPMPKK